MQGLKLGVCGSQSILSLAARCMQGLPSFRQVSVDAPCCVYIAYSLSGTNPVPALHQPCTSPAAHRAHRCATAPTTPTSVRCRPPTSPATLHPHPHHRPRPHQMPRCHLRRLPVSHALLPASRPRLHPCVGMQHATSSCIKSSLHRLSMWLVSFLLWLSPQDASGILSAPSPLPPQASLPTRPSSATPSTCGATAGSLPRPRSRLLLTHAPGRAASWSGGGVAEHLARQVLLTFWG